MKHGGLALAGLRGHARQLGATALAIMLSVGFLATVLLSLDALERGVGEAVAGDVVSRDLVAWPAAEMIGAGQVDALRQVTGVEVVDAPARVYGTVDGSSALATTAPRGPGVELLQGRMPAAPQEIVASSTSGDQVGDTVSFRPYRGDGEEAAVVELQVVGVMDLGPEPQFTWQDTFVAPESVLRAWDPALGYAMVTMDLTSAGEAAARQAVAEAAPGVQVLTGQQAASALVTAATGGLDLLGPILLGFGAIAVITSALVIANTFAIVLAQRTRELALLRCVGATRAQVRRSVLTEAVLLGGLAATAGVLLGIAVVWAAASLLGEVNLGMPVTLRPGWPWIGLLLPWVVGIAVTLVAAWWPTRRATRVAPVAALTPLATPAVASRPGGLRLLVALLLVGLGAAALVLAPQQQDVLLGVAGGLLSFIGVLVAAVFVVPAGIRALGTVLRGVPGRLAVGNTVANPSRAAATSAALLIGVTLITMTSVGAATAARTADQEINAEYPADVQVTPTCCQNLDSGAGQDTASLANRMPASLSEQSVQRLRELDGVAATTSLPSAWLQVGAAGSDWWTQSPVYGIDRQQGGEVLRDPSILDALQPGTIGFSADYLQASGLDVGDTVPVTGQDGTRQATVVQVEMGDFLMPIEELTALDHRAPDSRGMLLRLSEDADVSSVVADIRDIVAEDEVYVSGGAAARAELMTVLNVLVLVMTALLGVAVVIAVVGIGNTLALSVLERGRENALLRALGLTRGQLRGMLTVEGVLLAVVSAVLGLGLGVTYAWFGVATVLPADTDIALAVPVGRVSIILAVAVVAGLLASVLPARRAARTAPAAGLAAV